jgi:hypothetical protein
MSYAARLRSELTGLEEETGEKFNNKRFGEDAAAKILEELKVQSRNIVNHSDSNGHLAAVRELKTTFDESKHQRTQEWVRGGVEEEVAQKLVQGEIYSGVFLQVIRTFPQEWNTRTAEYLEARTLDMVSDIRGVTGWSSNADRAVNTSYNSTGVTHGITSSYNYNHTNNNRTSNTVAGYIVAAGVTRQTCHS